MAKPLQAQAPASTSVAIAAQFGNTDRCTIAYDESFLPRKLKLQHWCAFTGIFCLKSAPVLEFYCLMLV